MKNITSTLDTVSLSKNKLYTNAIYMTSRYGTIIRRNLTARNIEKKTRTFENFLFMLNFEGLALDE